MKLANWTGWHGLHVLSPTNESGPAAAMDAGSRDSRCTRAHEATTRPAVATTRATTRKTARRDGPRSPMGVLSQREGSECAARPELGYGAAYARVPFGVNSTVSPKPGA